MLFKVALTNLGPLWGRRATKPADRHTVLTYYFSRRLFWLSPHLRSALQQLLINVFEYFSLSKGPHTPKQHQRTQIADIRMAEAGAMNRGYVRKMKHGERLTIGETMPRHLTHPDTVFPISKRSSCFIFLLSATSARRMCAIGEPAPQVFANRASSNLGYF